MTIGSTHIERVRPLGPTVGFPLRGPRAPAGAVTTGALPHETSCIAVNLSSARGAPFQRGEGPCAVNYGPSDGPLPPDLASGSSTTKPPPALAHNAVWRCTKVAAWTVCMLAVRSRMSPAGRPACPTRTYKRVRGVIAAARGTFRLQKMQMVDAHSRHDGDTK